MNCVDAAVLVISVSFCLKLNSLSEAGKSRLDEFVFVFDFECGGFQMSVGAISGYFDVYHFAVGRPDGTR